MRPNRWWAARAGSATSSASTARWSDRAAVARRRNAAQAPAPRAAGEGTGTCPEPRAWSRRELRLPLTRHNYVDINPLCQSHYRGWAQAQSDEKARNSLDHVAVASQLGQTLRPHG